ncbi:MAG TPA: 4'-phosphopantetheinyl transferase superfamily protein [Lysobacter sp.]
MPDAPDLRPSRARSCLVALAELEPWQSWLDEAWSLLDPIERSRVVHRRQATDREALTIAYALHRMVIAGVLGIAPADVPLARDERGCPCLPGMSLHTSLSHAEGVAAFAVCAMGPVGIDIEPSLRACELPQVSTSVCHSAEARLLAGMREPHYSHELLALWVRKEALLKAEGIGLEREMTSFVAADGAIVPLTASAAGSSGPVRLSMLEIGPRWTAAVAAPVDAVLEGAWLRPVGGRVVVEPALYMS